MKEDRHPEQDGIDRELDAEECEAVKGDLGSIKRVNPSDLLIVVIVDGGNRYSIVNIGRVILSLLVTQQTSTTVAR